MTEGPSKEEKILRMLKRVLTDIAKDTSTPPGMKHPLSENTIQGIRECLGLISAREKELAEESGRPSRSRVKRRPGYARMPACNISDGSGHDGRAE